MLCSKHKGDFNLSICGSIQIKTWVFIMNMHSNNNSMVFAGEKVVNNWSRFVLVIWIFLVLILTQSYTASLTSILTVQRLKPTFVDVNEIIKNGYFVGYQNNSFVKELLKEQLDIHESKLKPYETLEEYHEALSNGTHNGGVAAIFDEIPYLKIFLANYPSKYTTVGPLYQTDGFGFVSLSLSLLKFYFLNLRVYIVSHYFKI